MEILKKIEEYIVIKKGDYRRYNFNQDQADALKTFFDLAQEFDTIEDLYRTCVAIPKCFFNLEAKLHLYDNRKKILNTVSETEIIEKKDILAEMKPSVAPYLLDNSLILTIYGKRIPTDEGAVDSDKENTLGMLEVYPADNLGENDKFFFQKFANRIGFNLHNRLLLQKHVEHLRFIHSLVADIEHNIIVPNMIFKLFLRRLKGKISKNKDIEKLLIRHSDDKYCDEICIEHLLTELTEVNRGLREEFGNIDKHYKNTSLFLETLLRKSHFDKGHLTLRTKTCSMFKDVVHPQLERYDERFKDMGIAVDNRFSDVPADEIITLIDVGLISQVYANFFSNALKYTEEVIDDKSEKKKLIAYGRKILTNYFGEGKDGVKFNVFSTGRHISVEERIKIFNEGYRGSNVGKKPGTGHGLTFIKNAIEIHGGVAGYEAKPYGNNFFFILPS